MNVIAVVMALLFWACSGGGDQAETRQTKPAQAPPAPVNLNAIPGNDQVILTWDIVPRASAYNLYWSTSPGVSKATANAVVNVSPGYRHGNLANGQKYYYIVTSTSTGGESLPSEELVAIPGGQLIAEVVSDVNLSHCLSAHSSTSPAYTDTVSGVIDCSYRGIDSLSGMQYIASATELNLAGNNIRDISPLRNLPHLNALHLNDNQLQRESDTVLAQLMQFGILNHLSLMDNVQLACEFIDKLVATMASFDITESKPGINCSDYGQSPAPTSPLAVEFIQAIPGDGKVTLMWDPSNAVSFYNVYWGTTAGVTKASEHMITQVQPPYVHLGLSNGSRYYYIVTAVTDAQEGLASQEVSAVPVNQGVGLTGIFADDNLQACVMDYANAKGWTFTHEIVGTLDCSSKSIKSLQGLEQLTELSELNLMNNTITDIESLPRMLKLSRLYLSHNQIKSIVGFAHVTSLQLVDLSHNSISDVSALAELADLSELHVSDNNIVDVGPLANLVNVELLDLRNNQIGGEQVGNIDDLVALSRARSILLAGNRDIACVELSALIAGLAPDTVDLQATIDGTDCLAVPRAPQNVQAAGGNQRNIITWDPVINADVFNLYWSNTPNLSISGADSNVNKIPNVRSGYQHTSLTNGLPYYYVVTAENASGQSMGSEEVTALPQQIQISGLFADNNLQACIGELAAANGWTMADEVSGVVNCSARAITNLAGLEHMTNMSVLSLNENNISDIAPLAYLRNLGVLSLYRNNITSVKALTTMTGLNAVFISSNLISNVGALGDLPQLQVLDLKNNRLGTSGGSGLEQLGGLAMATHVGIAGNKNLSCMEVQNLLDIIRPGVLDIKSAVPGINCTNGSRVPAGLKAISGDGQISLTWEQVPSASAYNIYWSTVAGTTATAGETIRTDTLHYVHAGLSNDTIYYYAISSESASGESALSPEIAAQPSANGVALSGLFPDPKLSECVNSLAGSHGWSYALEITGTLNCSAQQISDLNGIEQLANLEVLRLGSNNIEDITAVASLRQLTFLDLYNNMVSDVGALNKLVNLRTLYLHNNNISDITPLATLSNLDYLILDENSISDPTPVANLGNLTRLFFRANLLADISPLSGMSQLTELYLNNNGISNVTALANLLYLQQLDLRNNQIGVHGAAGVDSLVNLINVTKIRLSGNSSLPCTELAALGAVLGPNAIDLGEAQAGVNCQAP